MRDKSNNMMTCRFDSLAFLVLMHLRYFGGTSDSFEFYDISSCSNPLYNEVVRKNSTTEQSDIDTMLECVSRCGESPECDFAIYRSDQKWCKFISNNYSVSLTPPDYISDPQCFVLWRSKARCKNGGVLTRDLTCDCSDNFRGPECEDPNPPFCQSSSWRVMDESDIDWLKDSKIQTKVMFNESGSSVLLYDLSHFQKQGCNYRGEMNDGFSIDSNSESFTIPLRREFKSYYFDEVRKMNLLSFDLFGINKIEDTITDVDFTFLINNSTDPDRLVYKPDEVGTVSDVTSNILAGGRLYSRLCSRTGIDVTTGDVYFDRLQENIGNSGFNWFKPYYYFTARYSTLGNQRIARRTYIQTGSHKQSDKITYLHDWEIDTCWTKLAQSLNTVELFTILKSNALNFGKEIRLLMNRTVSTDIAMVFVTNSDIIVYLAEYLTPFDASSQFDVNSRVRFCLYSLSGMLSECEMEYQYKIIDGVTNVTYDMPVEWIVDSRSWDNIFIVGPDGTSSFGTKDGVIDAVSAGYNIRICLELSLKESLCYGSKEIRIGTDNHVLFKSISFIMPRVKSNGFFDGITESNCDKTVHLLSTKGWVKSTSYTLGDISSVNDVMSIPFLAMTWFRQL